MHPTAYPPRRTSRADSGVSAEAVITAQPYRAHAAEVSCRLVTYIPCATWHFVARFLPAPQHGSGPISQRQLVNPRLEAPQDSRGPPALPS